MTLLPPAAFPHLRVGRPGFHHIVPQLAPDGLRREAWERKIIKQALSPHLPILGPQGALGKRGAAQGGGPDPDPCGKRMVICGEVEPTALKGREIKNWQFCWSSKGAELQQGPHRCVNPPWDGGLRFWTWGGGQATSDSRDCTPGVSSP